MILWSHSWAYIWRKTWFERIHAPQYSLQCCFTIAKTWKQSKFPLKDEWIKKIYKHTHIYVYIHTETYIHTTVQFSSVAQSCPTLCDPMDCSMSGFPVHHQLPELAQIHVHWADDAIQPSHPRLPSFPFAFLLSQHQSLFQWVGCSHQVALVLELQLQHQSFQWIFRVDFL